MNANEYHFIFERSSLSRTPVIQRFAYDGAGKVEYYGLARKGSATSSPVWLIEKYIYDGDNLSYTLMSDPTAVWDDYATTTYS